MLGWLYESSSSVVAVMAWGAAVMTAGLVLACFELYSWWEAERRVVEEEDGDDDARRLFRTSVVVLGARPSRPRRDWMV